MRNLIRAAAIVAMLSFPAAVSATPFDELDGLIGRCETGPEAACADELWRFADVTGDDRLTGAELTRFIRLVVEWGIAEQAAASGGTDGADPFADSDRFGALAAAGLIGPFIARLVIENYDYNGDGVLERGEVFADSDEGQFVETMMTQAELLPQHAGMLFMRMLEAQQMVDMGIMPAE